jgi:SAM-dependent methyltransferase
MKLVGLDPLMHEYSKLCPMNNTIEWRTGYLEHLDVDDDAYPVAFCSNAIDHVEDLDRAMTELRRVVRPRGYLVLTVDVFAREIARNVGHPYTFTAKSIRRTLEANGFRSTFSYLERRKLGMGPYARYRLRDGLSRREVLRRAWFRKVPKAWCKQLLRRGSLGELIMVAQKS